MNIIIGGAKKVGIAHICEFSKKREREREEEKHFLLLLLLRSLPVSLSPVNNGIYFAHFLFPDKKIYSIRSSFCKAPSAKLAISIIIIISGRERAKKKKKLRRMEGKIFAQLFFDLLYDTCFVLRAASFPLYY